ncbi:MAG: hypothetical protein A3G34_10995 [Candidatus Lindowbacteria bacterium RIFCSPLOWO2_12_FULL_62_27]|nr:MAG: hypothetical protein A3G34_10995 [Candidatus Lindowbacteria bacterium RIFCSPLOWO2_12_FULL_62_27]
MVKSGGQRKRHATDLNKLLRFFGNDKISVVSQARLTQYVEYRRAQPFSKDNTIKKEIELLARVVDAGILEKLVTENNIRLVLRMRSLGFEAQSPTRQEIWRVLTGQELRVVDDVLSSVDDTDFWLLVERETGNRAAQVRRIRWDHVRLSRRGIFVPPKNEKSKKLKRGRGRVMMLSNRLIAGLRAYATHCGLQYDAARDRFVDSSGDVAVVALLPQFAERKCSENTISSEMSDRFRVLIGERLGAASYCLRKTVASVWYHAATRISFDMVRLAKHFGHTVAELERDYADALPSGLRDELLRAEETLKAWLQAQNEMVDEDGENGSASSLPFQRIRRPMLYPTELRAHWDYQTVTKQCDNSKSTCAKFVQNFRIDHIREQPFHRMRTWMPPPLS